MAKTRTVIDIVGFKAGPNQFLEQISFFVAAFGTAKTG